MAKTIINVKHVNEIHQHTGVMRVYPARKRRLEVFVSSTSLDLADHRTSAIRAISKIGHVPRAMEFYGAVDNLPVTKCLEDVSTSDAYVGILAWRYGFIPSGFDRSITELEYRAARSRKLPRFIFLLDQSADWPCELRDDPDNEVRNFRASLESERIVSYFDTPDKLAAEVIAALTNHASGAQGCS